MRDPTSIGDDRLNRICSFCGVGFLVVVVLLVILDHASLPSGLVHIFFVLAALAIYAAVGVSSRTMSLPEFQLAGRRIPSLFAGVAAGAEWAAVAIILSATGSLLLASHDWHALVLALTGGYVLAAVLVNPFLRNSGAVTIPDFMGVRFGPFARFFAVIMLVACSLPLAAALVQLTALVIAGSLGLDVDTALYVVVAMLALAALPGGMRGVAASQVAQYVVLTISAVALFLIVEAQRFDAPAGSSYDPLAQAWRAIARGMGLSPSLSPRSIPFNMPETVSNLELVLCLMAGTASLPHILVRSVAMARTEQARTEAAWSLFFIALLVFTLPTFFAIAADEGGGDRSGVSGGLVIVIELTAMLAAASSVTLALANSLAHDVCGKAAAGASPATRLLVARVMLAAVLALVVYGATTLPPEPLSFVAWSFSLAAAGYFPALVLGIWWERTTTAAAVCGMIAGFGVALFYLVVSRYFPQAGVLRFGMSSLVDPSGQPLVDVAQVLGDPRWLADAPASAANPLASKVGWLNVSTLACGIFGMPVGFLVIVALSLLGGRSPPERKSAIDAVRTPANARIYSG